MVLAAVVVHSTAMAGLKNVCTHRRIAGPVITHGGNTTSASDNDSVCQDAARYGLAHTWALRKTMGIVVGHTEVSVIISKHGERDDYDRY